VINRSAECIAARGALSFPYFLSPVRTYYPVPQSTCYQSTMSWVCTENMASSAKRPQVLKTVRRVSSALNVVDVTLLK